MSVNNEICYYYDIHSNWKKYLIAVLQNKQLINLIHFLDVFLFAFPHSLRNLKSVLGFIKCTDLSWHIRESWWNLDSSIAIIYGLNVDDLFFFHTFFTVGSFWYHFYTLFSPVHNSHYSLNYFLVGSSIASDITDTQALKTLT